VTPTFETAFPPRGAPLLRLPSPQGHHVVRRVQDALDLRCEGLECFALLSAELVPVKVGLLLREIADPLLAPERCG
jgi:hypothetical protein